MTISEQNYIHPYASFVKGVQKPARYLGGEYNQVRKAWDSVDCRFCMGFPDLYDIGMSHMGTKILYSVINNHEHLLMERVFCPWPDMEEELRARNLPLLSLENHRSLKDFDVVGFSLQYEMTFTNVLTMLDLGGIPLRTDDRSLDDPLIMAGGPTCTHPEPIAPFIDAFLIGDAEERLPQLLTQYAELKAEGGRSRKEILIELAAGGGVYCPSLYTTAKCERSDLMYVDGTVDARVPARVERVLLDDINKFAFPSDSPVAVAEAIFDRMSVEIARGCTEGCRFCQAGMIYRPVRERDPKQIIDTVLSAVDTGGYDEASLTALSTADFSCVSPLVKQLMDELRERKVSLGISSLRAYGLDEDLLDDIQSVKATGLTFAPEAGTQRMRDVINKNISEEDIFTTCHRVFSRGWRRMKLYFIIGLPTEEDEDVEGVAEMGLQALRIGRKYSGATKVTVSVSSHVPKPHTPFQWARMDTKEEIDRKQRFLLFRSRKDGFAFRRHDMHVSHLEGIIARGDRRVGDLIELAWRKGARFDSWDEKLNKDAWYAALDEWEEAEGIERRVFLDTLPVDGKLPWDHIDVGLKDGFLRREYQRAVKSRLSPPCGKPVGAKVHHTNLEDANADARKLVCYNCGIACDMSGMRQERLDFLEKMGAERPPQRDERRTVVATAKERMKQGLSPHDFDQGEKRFYRLRYARTGAVALRGHLDMVRVVPRMLRRAGYEPWYSQGFSPKPVMMFGTALSLGTIALGEYVDVALCEEVEAQVLLEGLNAAAADGFIVTGVRRLNGALTALSHSINAFDYAVLWERSDLLAWAGTTEMTVLRARVKERIETIAATDSVPVTILRKKKSRTLDLREVLLSVSPFDAAELPDWAGIDPTLVGLRLRIRFDNEATLKPQEAAAAVLGGDNLPEPLAMARLAGVLRTDDGDVDPITVGEGSAPATRTAEEVLAHRNAVRSAAGAAAKTENEPQVPSVIRNDPTLLM